MQTPIKRILRVASVAERTGLSKGAIYYQIKRGQFPPSIPLGTRSAGWLEAEIDAWIDERVRAARGIAEARELA